MLLSFLDPFPIRNLPAPLLWAFYRQLGKFSADDVAYIGSPDYFADPVELLGRRLWEAHPATQSRLNFAFPASEQVASVRKHFVDVSLFDPLLAQTTSAIRAWTSLMTTEYPPLCQRLEEIFRATAKDCRIDAVLTFCNSPSLQKVARRFGAPVIHNELGALRAPQFQPTVYFDFQGVNGNTEAAKRYQQFRREIEQTRMPLLSIEELLALIGAPNRQPSTSRESPGEFELGLPLQVEDDSNLIAYGNGYSNYELIMTAFQFVANQLVLVRPHPYGSLDYRRAAWKSIRIDESATSLDFIGRCKRIATINSSVALESMLLGCPTCILGQSPFNFMITGGLDALFSQPGGYSQERLRQLNFAVLAYLVPESFLYDNSYCQWRLGQPSELEIYRFHLDYYRTESERASRIRASKLQSDIAEWLASEEDDSAAA